MSWADYSRDGLVTGSHPKRTPKQGNTIGMYINGGKYKELSAGSSLAAKSALMVERSD
jgi:hypothetical protein